MGRKYLDSLRGEMVRLAMLADQELDGRAVKSLADKLSHRELEELKQSFARRAEERLPVKPQLAYGEREAVLEEQDRAFMV